MSKPKFTGYHSPKPRYFRELWMTGPVRTEARRLAKIDLEVGLRAKGKNPRLFSERQLDLLVTQMLLESESVYLMRALFNLEETTK